MKDVKACYLFMFFFSRKVNNGEKEDYMYTGKYYELRKEPGLGKIKLGKLW